MKLWIALALVPSLTFADSQANIACDLAHAQAEVTAAELTLPSAFVLAGDPSVSQKTIAVGLSESASGWLRAHKLREAADAQCGSIRSSLQIDSFLQLSTLDIQKRGAVAALKELYPALDMATANVSKLQEQLKPGVVDLATVDAALIELRTLQDRAHAYATAAAVPTPALTDTDVGQLVAAYEADQGRAAQLTASASAHSGWDFVVDAGVKKPLGSQLQGLSTATTPFVTASVKYSFGSAASLRAAAEVGRDTKLLLASTQLGYSQTLDRHRQEARTLVEAEDAHVTYATQLLASFRALQAPLLSLESTPALNARRSLEVQIKAEQAELAAATVRSEGYRALLRQMN